jgi:hypothetical protein
MGRSCLSFGHFMADATEQIVIVLVLGGVKVQNFVAWIQFYQFSHKRQMVQKMVNDTKLNNTYLKHFSYSDYLTKYNDKWFLYAVGLCNVIRFATTDFYVQYMNIKTNEVCKIKNNAFEKHVLLFAIRHFTLVSVWWNLHMFEIISYIDRPTNEFCNVLY